MQGSILPCKTKMQYLLTIEVNRFSHLALQGSIVAGQTAVHHVVWDYEVADDTDYHSPRDYREITQDQQIKNDHVHGHVPPWPSRDLPI